MKTTIDSLIIAIIVILLILLLLWMGKPYIKQALLGEVLEKQERLYHNIEALKDSVQLVRRTTDSVVYKTKGLEATEREIKQLLENQPMSDEQRKWLKEIKETKSLVSSIRGKFVSIDSVLQSISGDTISGVTLTDDSVHIKKGTKLEFTDIQPPMTWDAKLLVDDTMGFSLDYRYTLDFEIQHTRKDDGSIDVIFSANDPNLNLGELNSYTIPVEQRTAFERWIRNNKRWVYPLAGGIVFGTGVYVGNGLAK